MTSISLDNLGDLPSRFPDARRDLQQLVAYLNELRVNYPKGPVIDPANFDIFLHQAGMDIKRPILEKMLSALEEKGILEPRYQRDCVHGHGIATQAASLEELEDVVECCFGCTGYHDFRDIQGLNLAPGVSPDPKKIYVFPG